MFRHAGWIGALLSVGLGFALRVGALGEFWLNGDEGIYYFIAHAPPRQAAMAVTFHAHPPVYFYLLRAVAQLGDSFVWLRLPSLLFGCLTIVAMYTLARRLAGDVAGVIAALLTAVSPGLIMQSQVVRPYALQTLLIATALAALCHFVKGGGRHALFLYAAAMVVGVSIQYGTVVAAGGIGLSLAALVLLARFDAVRIRDLALAHVPLGAVMLALYITHVRPRLMGSEMQASAVGSSLRPYFIDGPVDAWHNGAALIEYLAGAPLAGAAWIAFWLAVAVCLVTRNWFIVGSTLAVVAVALTLSAADLYPFGGSRHTLYLAPFAIATLSVGLGRIAALGAPAAIGTAVGLAVLSGVSIAADGAVGIPAERAKPFVELEIPAREVSELIPALESVRDTPGIAIFDKVTAYTLAPILQDSRVVFKWVGEPKLRYYRWGRRWVFTVDAWFANLGGSTDALTLLRRIAKDVPDGRSLIDGDVRVLSFSGQNIPDAIASLDRLDSVDPLASEIHRTRHFSLFRLDVRRYRKQVQRSLRGG